MASSRTDRPGASRRRAHRGAGTRAPLLATALLLAVAAAAAGSAAGPALPGGAPPSAQAPPYQDRYTFVRIRYGEGGGFGRFGRGGGSWAHDYPDADRNMQQVLGEITTVQPALETTVVVELEDPALFSYPLLYMSEPGFWRVTERGAANLRQHLLKGGFIVFDDFDGYGHWESFEVQMARALPGHRLIELDQSHPVFRTFFELADIYVPHPMVRVTPRYFGVFEDNDPDGRMMALVNYNSDLAEYWEHPSGYLPIDPTNDAFRLGVNYFLYGLTH